MVQSHYMRLITDEAQPELKTYVAHSVPQQKENLLKKVATNKWVWIAGFGMLAFKSKRILWGGLGLAGGYYLRGKVNQVNSDVHQILNPKSL